MSRASRSVNAAYIRSALEVKAQRDELLADIRIIGNSYTTDAERIAIARAAIKKAKKWT